MLKKYCFLPFLLAWAAVAPPALAAPPPETVPPQNPQKPKTDVADGDDDNGFGSYTPPPVAIKPRTFTLAECLALLDRNHPNLWAARARIGFARAQLDEARYTPWFQFSANAGFGMLPPLGGTPIYTSTPITARNLTGFGDAQPTFRFGFDGSLPLYTFGKITFAREAAEANVRVQEWDSEKIRQQTRMDLRRAYFGLMLARDAKFVIDEAISRLDKAVEGLKKRKDDKGIQPWDVMRLEVFRDEIRARTGEIVKAEAFAMAALKFLTGVQTGFDIPDKPLKRPDRPLANVVQYLSAARLFRPEVNQARAGVVARRKWADYQKARLFPDLGLGVGTSFSIAPSATPQTAWGATEPFNYFYYWFGVGLRWNLDILPQAARARQAEWQVEETRSLERLALGGVAVEVERAYGEVLDAKIREESFDRAEHKAKQWLATLQDHIDLGSQDERGLLEPLRVYGFQRINHLYALHDLNISMSQLALVSGWDSAAPSGD
jgi:multidrug efflux system outer membrane protein